jgi:large subunit ribosomal protein L17
MANTFKGRKFGRKRDEREALLAGLSSQLILNHSIRTTLGKAKELRPHVEKLVTLAKKQTLSSRRLVIARLDNNVEAGHYLLDVIVPSTLNRTSGYLRISKDGNRRGDNAEMARISFVDEIKEFAPAPVKEAAKPVKKEVVKKEAPKKAPAKKKVSAK